MTDTAALGFSLAPRLGPKTFLSLLSFFSSADTAWNAKKNELEQAGLTGKTLEGFLEFRKTFDVKKYEDKLQKNSVTILPYTDEQYPESLKRLPNPPIVLYVKGNAALNLCTSSISVVGNRKITTYGRQ